MGRVLANDPGDWGSIPGKIMPKTQKMVLDATLLNIQHYKVQIKGKVEQSRGKNCTLSYTSAMTINFTFIYTSFIDKYTSTNCL